MSLLLDGTNFAELNEQETRKIEAGGVGAVVGIVVGTLVVNEIVERTTGKDIVEHVGDGLVAVGNFLRGN